MPIIRLFSEVFSVFARRTKLISVIMCQFCHHCTLVLVLAAQVLVLVLVLATNLGYLRQLCPSV